MKNRLIAFLFFLFSGIYTQAQVAPQAINLIYTTDCMDLLEFRTINSGTTNPPMFAYLVKTSANERHTLYTGSGFYVNSIPQGAVYCRDFKVTDEIMSGVNSFKRQMFIVQQVQDGFQVVPVTSISKVMRNGSVYWVNSPNAAFALDTANLVLGRNIALIGSNAAVTLNNFGVRNCLQQYSFFRAPHTQGAEQAAFDFIPSLGIVSEKSGRTAAEIQANLTSLTAVNRQALDDFINSSCGRTSNTAPYTPPTPSGQQPFEPRPDDPNFIPAQPQPATPGTAMISAISKQPMVRCPQTSGNGYHVVQPKETLNGIARFYGVTTKELLTWNNLKNPDKITVCQVLRVSAQPSGYGAVSTPAYVDPTPSMQIAKTPVVAAPTQQTVVMPVAQPAASQPAYQATQPAQQGALPNLFGPAAQTYSYTTPQPAPTQIAAPTASITVPAQPYPTTVNTPHGQVYYVEKGEGIAAIARKFGITDEKMRQLNNFPPKGDVPFQIGQPVYVSDCPCPPGTSPIGSTLPPAPVSQPAAIVHTQPVATQPVATQPAAQTGGQGVLPVLFSTTPGGQTQQPAATQGNKTGFVPLGGVQQPGVNPQAAPNPPMSTAQPATTMPVGDPILKDYFVKEPKTLRDIARELKQSAEMLGLINSLDPNAVLAPGTKIQVPIY